MKKKLLIPLSCIVFLAISQPIFGTVKDASEVFKRWIQIQQVIPDCSFKDLSSSINEQFAENFKTSFEIQLRTLSKQKAFLTSLTGGCISEHGYQIGWPLNETFTENMKMIYELADTNIEELLNFFEKLGLFNETNQTNKSSNDLVPQFTEATQLLFSGQTEQRKYELMFNLANRYVEWTFGEKFPTHIQRMMVDREKHQLLRYLFSVIWQKLPGGVGWKDWHQNSLENIKTESSLGKTAVYIAGGSDIYQLIKNGVYNIINIDPQLPTQPRYYTNDWEFLLQGNIDDRIIFNDESTKIVMIRRSIKRTGKQFQATLATNQKIILDESETEWDLFDSNLNKVGTYTLKRRFCNQDDFALKENQFMVISLNELAYVCQTQQLGGWGIDISKLTPSFKLFVKQLRAPISRDTIINMHTAALLNTIDLGYISLGSCIN